MAARTGWIGESRGDEVAGGGGASPPAAEGGAAFGAREETDDAAPSVAEGGSAPRAPRRWNIPREERADGDAEEDEEGPAPPPSPLATTESVPLPSRPAAGDSVPADGASLPEAAEGFKPKPMPPIWEARDEADEGAGTAEGALALRRPDIT